MPNEFSGVVPRRVRSVKRQPSIHKHYKYAAPPSIIMTSIVNYNPNRCCAAFVFWATFLLPVAVILVLRRDSNTLTFLRRERPRAFVEGRTMYFVDAVTIETNQRPVIY